MLTFFLYSYGIEILGQFKDCFNTTDMLKHIYSLPPEFSNELVSYANQNLGLLTSSHKLNINYIINHYNISLPIPNYLSIIKDQPTEFLSCWTLTNLFDINLLIKGLLAFIASISIFKIILFFKNANNDNDDLGPDEDDFNEDDDADTPGVSVRFSDITNIQTYNPRDPVSRLLSGRNNSDDDNSNNPSVEEANRYEDIDAADLAIGRKYEQLTYLYNNSIFDNNFSDLYFSS